MSSWEPELKKISVATISNIVPSIIHNWLWDLSDRLQSNYTDNRNQVLGLIGGKTSYHQISKPRDIDL